MECPLDARGYVLGLRLLAVLSALGTGLGLRLAASVGLGLLLEGRHTFSSSIALLALAPPRRQGLPAGGVGHLCLGMLSVCT